MAPKISQFLADKLQQHREKKEAQASHSSCSTLLDSWLQRQRERAQAEREQQRKQRQIRQDKTARDQVMLDCGLSSDTLACDAMLKHKARQVTESIAKERQTVPTQFTREQVLEDCGLVDGTSLIAHDEKLKREAQRIKRSIERKSELTRRLQVALGAAEAAGCLRAPQKATSQRPVVKF